MRSQSDGVCLGAATSDIALFDAIAATDAHYFEAGASIDDLGGARLVHVPHFDDLAAGCVLLADRGDPADPDELIRRAEHVVESSGSGRFRWYVTSPSDGLVEALVAADYELRFESLLAAPLPSAATDARVRLREIRSALDWDQKVELTDADRGRPDGHDAEASRWVAFERLKSDVGAVRFFLVELNGDVVATIGLMRSGRIARLKNLYVHPEWRGRGVGGHVVQAARNVASAFADTCATFAVAGGAGERLYRRAGFEIVGYVAELTRMREM